MRVVFVACFIALLAAGQNPITWKVTGAPVKSGASATARLTATIEPGWHLYGMTQLADGPKPTRIWVPDGQPYKLKSEIKAPKPLRELDQNFGFDVEFYEREAIFQVPVKLDGKFESPLRVNVYFQSCNDRLCLPPKTVTVSATN